VLYVCYFGHRGREIVQMYCQYRYFPVLRSQVSFSLGAQQLQQLGHRHQALSPKGERGDLTVADTLVSRAPSHTQEPTAVLHTDGEGAALHKFLARVLAKLRPGQAVGVDPITAARYWFLTLGTSPCSDFALP
jgi:hypothetical protein